MKNGYLVLLVLFIFPLLLPLTSLASRALLGLLRLSRQAWDYVLALAGTELKR